MFVVFVAAAVRRPRRHRHWRTTTRDAPVTESAASPAGEEIAPGLAVGAGQETVADGTTGAVAAERRARVDVAPPRAVLARLEPGADGAAAAFVFSARVLVAPVVAHSAGRACMWMASTV